jgi:hypothetical protein
VAVAEAQLQEMIKADADPKDPNLTIVKALVTRARSGCRAARPLIDKAVASVADDPFVSDRLEVDLLSAQCQVETGQPARALAALEPDLKWLDQHKADPEASAPVRFTLARALAASGRDPTRAHALAEAARPALFGKDRADATQWLARNAATP